MLPLSCQFKDNLYLHRTQNVAKQEKKRKKPNNHWLQFPKDDCTQIYTQEITVCHMIFLSNKNTCQG